MKNFSRLALLASLLCALSGASRAATFRTAAATAPAGSVPGAINYQGRLVDNGFPVNATRTITFRLYDALTGGTLLYTVAPQQVVVSAGVFGTTMVISTSALAGASQKFLEVQIDGTVLAPREPLNSVPYALIARSVEDGIDVSTVSVGTQLVSSGTLSVNTIQALNGSSYFSIVSPVHMSSSTLILDGNAATSLTTLGKVGIGTGAPGQLLTLNGGGGDTHALLQNNVTGTGLSNGLDLVETIGGAGQLWNYQNGPLQFATAGSEQMRIDATGNVGIGAGALVPGAKLDVDGAVQFGSAGTKSAFSTLGTLTLANNAGLNLTGANGNVVSQASVTASAFFGNGANVSNVTAASVAAGNVTAGTFQNAAYTFTNAINLSGTGVWTATGRLGVGTVSPAQKIHMSSGTILIDGNTATSIITSGSVGIGAAPTNPLSVTGNANVTGTLTAGTFSGTVSGNATTASNLANGAANQIPVQSGANATTFIGAPGANAVLWGNGGAPSWTNTPTFNGSNLTSLTAANISAGTAGISISGNAATVTTNANLTGNVTSVGNATTIASLPAISGAALTSLTAANISAGTAGINITGNAGTATSANALAAADATGQSAIAAINAATAGIIGTARINAVNTVAFSATPTFNASLGSLQKITLTGNVTLSTLSGAVAGQTIVFLICQDAVGSRTFTWPVTMKGTTTVGGTLSTCTAQRFIYDGTFAYATAAGVINQ